MVLNVFVQIPKCLVIPLVLDFHIILGNISVPFILWLPSQQSHLKSTFEESFFWQNDTVYCVPIQQKHTPQTFFLSDFVWWDKLMFCIHHCISFMAFSDSVIIFSKEPLYCRWKIQYCRGVARIAMTVDDNPPMVRVSLWAVWLFFL